MGVLKSMLEHLAEITKKIDEAVSKGYNLSDWGDQMKFLHALQIQAQTLLDIVQRSCSLLGYAPRTYIESGRILLHEGIISEEEFNFYKAVVGFRNIVVHEYTRVNLRVVNEILSKREFRRILTLAEKIVLKLLERGLDP